MYVSCNLGNLHHTAGNGQLNIAFWVASGDPMSVYFVVYVWVCVCKAVTMNHLQATQLLYYLLLFIIYYLLLLLFITLMTFPLSDLIKALYTAVMSRIWSNNTTLYPTNSCTKVKISTYIIIYHLAFFSPVCHFFTKLCVCIIYAKYIVCFQIGCVCVTRRCIYTMCRIIGRCWELFKNKNKQIITRNICYCVTWRRHICFIWWQITQPANVTSNVHDTINTNNSIPNKTPRGLLDLSSYFVDFSHFEERIQFNNLKKCHNILAARAQTHQPARHIFRLRG